MYSRTAIVYNEPNKLVGVPPYYYRLRSCDTNLTSNTPANQYQRQKLIQNTVRVPSSIYTMNLGSLTAYRRPTAATYGVCWNQMSDRPVPSVQRAFVPTGSNNSLNNKHHSVTSSRPGGQSPGGVGCDIKHNSYDRYLNRLKGKGPLRRGVVPDTLNTGVSTNYDAISANSRSANNAFPIYGGKFFKTNIVNGCDCPIEDKQSDFNRDVEIYRDPFYWDINTISFRFAEGDYVYAVEPGNTFYTRAIITADNGNGTFDILFDDGTIETNVPVNELKIYYPCNCGTTINGVTYATGVLDYGGTGILSACVYPVVTGLSGLNM